MGRRRLDLKWTRDSRGNWWACFGRYSLTVVDCPEWGVWKYNVYSDGCPRRDGEAGTSIDARANCEAALRAEVGA